MSALETDDGHEISWGGVAFGLVFAAVGALAVLLAAVLPWLAMRAARGWTETTCTIESSAVTSERDSEGDVDYWPSITYRYAVAGRAYRAERIDLGPRSTTEQRAATLMARYPVGARVPCFHDGDRPTDVVLERGPAPRLPAAVFGFGLFLLGLGAAIAAVVRDATRRRHGDDGWRLPRRGLRPAADLVMEAGLAVAGAAPALELAATDGVGARLLLAPFAALALGLQLWFLRSLLRAIAPRIEVIARGPARPGGKVELVVTMRGLTPIRAARALVVGREERTIDIGENERVEHEVFFTAPVGAQVHPGRRARIEGTIELPTDRPTDRDRANAVRWVVTVEADSAGWPDVRDEYELLVEADDER